MDSEQSSVRAIQIPTIDFEQVFALQKQMQRAFDEMHKRHAKMYEAIANLPIIRMQEALKRATEMSSVIAKAVASIQIPPIVISVRPHHTPVEKPREVIEATVVEEKPKAFALGVTKDDLTFHPQTGQISLAGEHVVRLNPGSRPFYLFLALFELTPVTVSHERLAKIVLGKIGREKTSKDHKNYCYSIKYEIASKSKLLASLIVKSTDPSGNPGYYLETKKLLRLH